MDVKSFILENWKLLVLVLLIIINIITNLTRKKVKVVDVMALVLRKVPEYVLDAEDSGLEGKAKYTMVFSRLLKDLVALTGLSYEQVAEKYSIQLDDAIENNVKLLNKFKEMKGENNEKV